MPVSSDWLLQYRKKFYLKTFVSECTQWFSMLDFLILSQTLKPIQELLGPLRALRPAPYLYSSVQFSSAAKSCPTLCDSMDCSMPGLPVHHQLLRFTQTHVHWVDNAIQSPHLLSPPSPPALRLSQRQGFF